MYQYSLYLFKPRYAHHFYYKIDVLFKFLLEQYNFETTAVKTSQVEAVLQPIHTYDVLSHVQHSVEDNIYIDFSKERINIIQGEHHVTVYMRNYCMDIHADSLFIADRLFFQYIKSFHPHIFVVNFDSHDCGWISPLANKELYRYN